MLRFLFWLVVLVLVVLVLDGDLPMPGAAEEEIVYETDVPVSTCGTAGCVVAYTLEVANTGRSTQDAVRVRLRSDAIASPVIAPTVRRESEAAPAEISNERGGTDVVTLGKVAPEERVALVFALHASTRESAAGWDRVLVGVETTRGAARPGDVGAISLGRLVNGAARFVQPLFAAARQAIAKH